jgi:hypothetical protein
VKLLLAILVRWLLIVSAARLIYELITPITPGFVLVLASLLGIRLIFVRRWRI